MAQFLLMEMLFLLTGQKFMQVLLEAEEFFFQPTGNSYGEDNKSKETKGGDAGGG